MFYSKLSDQLAKENQSVPLPLRLSKGPKPPEPHQSLTRTLTEECIAHFQAAVEAPPPLLVEESTHPYENNIDIRKKFHIKGAAKLLIKYLTSLLSLSLSFFSSSFIFIYFFFFLLTMMVSVFGTDSTLRAMFTRRIR
jgi:hypothetical protein